MYYPCSNLSSRQQDVSLYDRSVLVAFIITLCMLAHALAGFGAASEVRDLSTVQMTNNLTAMDSDPYVQETDTMSALSGSGPEYSLSSNHHLVDPFYSDNFGRFFDLEGNPYPLKIHLKESYN